MSGRTDSTGLTDGNHDRTDRTAPTDGNHDRFSGFADLYDAHRPMPPARLGAILCRYAGAALGTPRLVDLGSGTGLSSRWAAGWAATVIGVEPNGDMRAQAESRPVPGVRYRRGASDATNLPAASADVVLAVQAMHWMEPASTHAEVARVLRPGGVFAIVDADWPPVTGLAGAERAWDSLHRRMRVFEARLAGGTDGADLRRPIDDDDPALVHDDLRDPHRNRSMPDGVRSWSKRDHLDRLQASGLFGFAREIVMDATADGGAVTDGPAGGGADRFVALLRSQGSYQGLRKRGLSDEELGVPAFEDTVHAAYEGASGAAPMAFCWRIRLGVRIAAPTLA